MVGLKGAEIQYKFLITRLIHEDKHTARVLAAIIQKPLSVEQISKSCNIPSEKCLRVIRKLKDNGLLSAVKQAAAESEPDNVVFLYKARLNQKIIRFENGRFKVIFPAVFRLTNGKKIVIREITKS